MRWSKAVNWYFINNSKYLYLVKYQNPMFSHLIIIISLTSRNLPLLKILQKQVNSEFSKISSFSSKRRHIENMMQIYHAKFRVFHAF
jgi:hypothetical protein